jgi:predicted nuclease of predicted toxin-antitoxin system
VHLTEENPTIIRRDRKMDDIGNKRAEISKLLILKSANIKNGTISTISTADLKLMFELYDPEMKHHFESKRNQQLQGVIKK